jgi:hypothetical protein
VSQSYLLHNAIMKNLTLCFSLLFVSVLGLSAARADTPQEGTRELRLGGSSGALGVYGPGISDFSPEHGKDMTLISMGLGFGYFVSSNVEVGGSIGYFQMSGGGSSSTSSSTKIKGPGFSAFFRLYSRTGNVGLFLEPTLEFQYLSESSVSIKILGPGVDAGFEFFLADSWAFRLSPNYRYYKEWASGNGSSNEGSIQKFGLTWGISAYF